MRESYGLAEVCVDGSSRTDITSSVVVSPVTIRR